MVREIHDRKAVIFLSNKLSLKQISLIPEANEENISRYEERVRKHLIDLGEEVRNIDLFLNEVRFEYEKSMPSSQDIEWVKNDARASYWLLCKIDQLESKLDEPLLITNLALDSNVKQNELGRCVPPKHELRIQYIYKKIECGINVHNLKVFITEMHNAWSEHIQKNNLFRAIGGKGVEDAAIWLLKYLNEAGVSLKGYSPGESYEEIIAYCYASYFIWVDDYFRSEAECELFKIRFNNAYGSKKGRDKKKISNCPSMNVNISQETHDKIRSLAIERGITNARVIEWAIELAWKKKA